MQHCTSKINVVNINQPTIYMKSWLCDQAALTSITSQQAVQHCGTRAPPQKQKQLMRCDCESLLREVGTAPWDTATEVATACIVIANTTKRCKLTAYPLLRRHSFNCKAGLASGTVTEIANNKTTINAWPTQFLLSAMGEDLEGHGRLDTDRTTTELLLKTLIKCPCGLSQNGHVYQVIAYRVC